MLGERISERMQALGLTQSELARRVGVTQPAIHALINRNKTGSKSLAGLARELRTTAAYLNGDTNDPDEGAPPVPTQSDVAEHLDLVAIASVDQEYGLGLTYADQPVDVEVMHFPRSWVDSLTKTSPALLTWARGRGDSMWPTIGDSDLLLIDRSERRIQDQDLIWAFTIGQFGAIKRLRIRGSRITILSDNQLVPPEEVDADEINIVGRVSHIIKRA